jgi:Oxysterol-binding protein
VLQPLLFMPVLHICDIEFRIKAWLQDADAPSVPLVRMARTSLPHPAPLSMGISIWSVLKSAIGKDLTKLTLPATINEPLSALQVLSEDMAQCHFLDSARGATSPAARMLWVAMFAFTPVSGSIRRYRKPFNPLLGETFEWLARDGGHRMLVEQVRRLSVCKHLRARLHCCTCSTC